jgi:nucleotide-binding universal stress UspA family protein
MMRDIKRLLCPVDLSDVSRHALGHAALIARWYGARIEVLHVCNPIVIPSADFTIVGTGPAQVLTDEEIKEAREQVLAHLASAGPIDADVLVESGRAATRILERATSLPADLIVIGTHGASGFEHLVLGSVTEKVLRQATCPVLTVPPRSRSSSKLPYKRLLCPIDLSASSLTALAFAFSLAQEGDAALTILHVFEWPADDEPIAARPFSVPEYRRERERDASAKLGELVPDSVRQWCQPRTRLSHGKAYGEILSVAAEEASDLIVMGVHGRNALDLMLFGSTTNQVVRRATCPVLTVRG